MVNVFGNRAGLKKSLHKLNEIMSLKPGVTRFFGKDQIINFLSNQGMLTYYFQVYSIILWYLYILAKWNILNFAGHSDLSQLLSPTVVAQKQSLRIPWRPVVRTSRFRAEGLGSIPGWGAEIPQAMQRNQRGKNKTSSRRQNTSEDVAVPQ